MSEAILCPPQGPITNKAGVWARGPAGRGRLRSECRGLSLPDCRLLWRSNTLTVAWSNAAMQKHINTCGWCEQPPVRRVDAHTHVMATKTTEDQVAACAHKSMWSTVMCVTYVWLGQCTHADSYVCKSHSFVFHFKMHFYTFCQPPNPSA